MTCPAGQLLYEFHSGAKLWAQTVPASVHVIDNRQVSSRCVAQTPPKPPSDPESYKSHSTTKTLHPTSQPLATSEEH